MSQKKPPKDYFCLACHEPCRTESRNFGIGSYEFWGATSSDDNWQEVSECCDADVVLTLEELNEAIEESRA